MSVNGLWKLIWCVMCYVDVVLVYCKHVETKLTGAGLGDLIMKLKSKLNSCDLSSNILPSGT